MQTIDPIKPTKPRRAPTSTPPPHPRQQSMQDVRPQRPFVRQTPATNLAQPQTGGRFTKLPAKKRARHIPWNTILPVVLSPTMILTAKFGAVSMAIAGLAVIVLLVLRMQSRVQFILALMGLLYIIGLQFSGSAKLAQAVAALVYIFFVGGGIALLIEVRSGSKLWFKKHH